MPRERFTKKGPGNPAAKLRCGEKPAIHLKCINIRYIARDPLKWWFLFLRGG
jgi:hypothetical protein